jgi:hypothetical protein
LHPSWVFLVLDTLELGSWFPQIRLALPMMLIVPSLPSRLVNLPSIFIIEAFSLYSSPTPTFELCAVLPLSFLLNMATTCIKFGERSGGERAYRNFRKGRAEIKSLIAEVVFFSRSCDDSLPSSWLMLHAHSSNVERDEKKEAPMTKFKMRVTLPLPNSRI